jgi:hypothetical protein
LLYFAFLELFGLILVRRFLGHFHMDFFKGIMSECLVPFCG